jgi:hypothetical protein
MKKQTDEKGNLLTYWGGLDSNGVEKTKHLKRNNMEKQTAVEKAIDLINKDFEENGRLRFAYVQKVLHEAKEMERQQIIDAYIKGYIAPLSTIKNWDAEQYYNETYNNETTNND